MSDGGQRAAAWPALACAAVAVLVFAPTIGFGFVYDDHRFVEANAALGDPSIAWRAFSEPATQTADGTHAGLWRPLRTLSFALDRALLGTSAWGGHVTNVLLHGAGAALLVRLLQSLGLASVAAAAGGLVYAVHPVQVETVAWISSRGDLLAAALVWIALLLQRPGRAWAAWAAGAAALLCKEQAVVWPAFAALVAALRGERPGAALRQAAIPAGLCVVFWGLRQALLTDPLQEGGLGAVGGGEVARMLAHQAWYLALPVGGIFDWQLGAPAGGSARLVLGLAGLFVVGGVLWRRTRVPTAWLLAALVPTLFVQLVVPLNIRVADRFLLFALPAVALLVGRAVALSRRCRVGALVAVACLLALTLRAQPVWASDATLWRHTVEHLPDHWRGHTWRGVTLLQEGDVEGAVRHLERAVDLAPDDAKTRFRLAEALEMRAARTEGDAVVAATRAARDEYAAAINRYRSGRQENRALLQPLAHVRAIDLTLALGDIESATVVLTRWLDTERPRIPAAGVPSWNRDLARLIAHVEQHLDPELERPLAPYLREWLVRP